MTPMSFEMFRQLIFDSLNAFDDEFDEEVLRQAFDGARQAGWDKGYEAGRDDFADDHFCGCEPSEDW